MYLTLNGYMSDIKDCKAAISRLRSRGTEYDGVEGNQARITWTLTSPSEGSHPSVSWVSQEWLKAKSTRVSIIEENGSVALKFSPMNDRSWFRTPAANLAEFWLVNVKETLYSPDQNDYGSQEFEYSADVYGTDKELEALGEVGQKRPSRLLK